MKIQISDTYRKVMSKISEIPGLSGMFEKWSLGRLPHLYLRQLCFGMPNDMIGKVCITIRKKGWKLSITFWWRRNSICWGRRCLMPMQWPKYDQKYLEFSGPFFGAGHLAFSASSNIGQGWCIIADERVICWWRISDRLPASADYWGWSAINLLSVFVRIRKNNIRWK